MAAYGSDSDEEDGDETIKTEVRPPAKKVKTLAPGCGKGHNGPAKRQSRGDEFKWEVLRCVCV
jgi:hypothetical protein